MKSKGWDGPPIDVVKFENGLFGTLDNTRLLAAHEAGIDAKTFVHDFSELLTPEEVKRFATKKMPDPKNWDDAFKARIGKQNKDYRKNNPSGSYTINGKN